MKKDDYIGTTNVTTNTLGFTSSIYYKGFIYTLLYRITVLSEFSMVVIQQNVTSLIVLLVEIWARCQRIVQQTASCALNSFLRNFFHTAPSIVSTLSTQFVLHI